MHLQVTTCRYQQSFYGMTTSFPIILNFYHIKCKVQQLNIFISKYKKIMLVVPPGPVLIVTTWLELLYVSWLKVNIRKLYVVPREDVFHKCDVTFGSKPWTRVTHCPIVRYCIKYSNNVPLDILGLCQVMFKPARDWWTIRPVGAWRPGNRYN